MTSKTYYFIVSMHESGASFNKQHIYASFTKAKKEFDYLVSVVKNIQKNNPSYVMHYRLIEQNIDSDIGVVIDSDPNSIWNRSNT